MNCKYKLWCEKAQDDIDLISELKEIVSDESAINDAFYKDLEFGTGGLRGVIGAGTNRINFYTVCKASQGLVIIYSVKSTLHSKAKADLIRLRV